MIVVFHASSAQQNLTETVSNERELLNRVLDNLNAYHIACRVKHAELDIAFAATGGPSQWVNVDNMAISYSPKPDRATRHGDILVEMANGYVNLSTPAGFIPLVDVIEENGRLKKITLS